MKIEIRSHFWPATPDLREIKILIDGEIVQSSFMDCNNIWDLARQFRNFDEYLMTIGNRLHDKLVEK
jgi:hypothetical protein